MIRRCRVFLTLATLPPAAVAAIWLAHTQPLEIALQRAQTRVLDARVRITRRQRDNAAFAAYMARESVPLHKLPLLLNRLVGPASAPPRFLPLFRDLARSSGVKLASCRLVKAGLEEDAGLETASQEPGGASPPVPQYATVPFALSLRGPLSGILAFVGALETQPRPITMQGIQIQRKGKPGSPLTADLNVAVVVRATP